MEKQLTPFVYLQPFHTTVKELQLCFEFKECWFYYLKSTTYHVGLPY